MEHMQCGISDAGFKASVVKHGTENMINIIYSYRNNNFLICSTYK